MRITIVGPAYPLRGGIAHHVYWLYQRLRARDHSVQVISFTRLYPQMFFPGTTEMDESRLKLDAGAMTILDPLNPVTWLRSLKEIKTFKPDFAVIQWWNSFFSPVVGALLRLLEAAGIKCIVECHNVLPHERTLLDLLLLDYAFAPADHFITHSQKDRLDLLEVAPGKNVKVASLPPLEEFSSTGGSSRKGRAILFFGLVRRYKGVQVLLRAMPKVLSQVECKLLIAGEFYDPVEKYEALIDELGIRRHVEIDNRYAANEEVVEIFNRADVLVLPYLNATQSGVAQIAFANHLPVIASRTGGLSEAVIENITGLLFPPGDSKALAEAIIKYFMNNLGPAFASNLKRIKEQARGKSLDVLLEEMAERDIVCQKSRYARG